MSDIKIILAGQHHDFDDCLALIGVAFEKDEGEWPSKYGTDYENDIFMMKRYCWCESDDCVWCCGCRCPEENWVKKKGDKFGTKVKWTCAYCTGTGIFSRFAYRDGSPFHDDKIHYWNPPNFWFKPTDFRLSWYKYIGRGTEQNGRDLPGDFLVQIFNTHPAGMTIEQAISKLGKAYGETSAMWRSIADSVGASIENEQGNIIHQAKSTG